MPRGEGITKLSALFEKYKKQLKAPEGTVIEAFTEVVADILNITIKRSQLRYTPHNKTLYIVSGGPLKSEILLHKAEIIAHVKGRIGDSAPSEII